MTLILDTVLILTVLLLVVLVELCRPAGYIFWGALQGAQRHIDNKSKATCFIVLVVPAHTLLCVEKFSHSLQETEVVKEADEHVRFAVPQAVPSPVYRNACHGHVSLYVTAKNRRAGKIKHNK